VTRDSRNLRLAIALGVAAVAVYVTYVLLRVLDAGA
jgi:hypothetical protein